MKDFYSIPEACQKIEYYCKYQERCHQEVLSKLISFKLNRDEIDQVLEFVFANDLLNEERFAKAFARGKHRIKYWGKVRISIELKLKNIGTRIIATALKEIDDDGYLQTFDKLSLRCWENILEKNSIKKHQKFCDYMLRKGYESSLVYAKINELKNS